MYARQSIDASDIEAIVQSLKGEFITRGPKVKEFEESLSKYCDAQYAVVMNSGSTALEACYFAADAGPADRLITTPNTFIATISRGVDRGMTPVFIDIDRNNGSFSLEQLEYNLDFQSTRGREFIVPVHFAGIAIDMKRLSDSLKNPNSVVIEDAAHALGSLYPSGEKVGSCAYSDMTILSFHPAKTITTAEGGAVLTNDPILYEKLISFRNNGIKRKSHWEYDCEALTGNYHFTEMQGALGVSQMKRLPEFINKRRALVKRYRELFKDFDGIKLFTDAQDDYTAFHLMVIQIDSEKYSFDRTELIEKLKQKNVGTQYHYIPLYRFSVLKKQFGDLEEYFPEMEKYYKEALSLPLYYDLELKDVDRIVETLKLILR